MTCPNPLFTLGVGGGRGGVVDNKASLGQIFAIASPSDGDRVALTNNGSLVGIWRFSTTLGSVWVPEGFIDLGAVGSDVPLGAGVDGIPTGNGGAGSIPYVWDANGIYIDDTGSTNVQAFWEWELIGGKLQVTFTFSGVPEVGDQMDITVNGQTGTHIVDGVTLNDEVDDLRAALVTALAAEPVTVGGASPAITVTADVGGVPFTYSSLITLVATGSLAVAEQETGGVIDWCNLKAAYISQRIVFSGAVVAYTGPYLGEYRDNDANNNAAMFRYQFNGNQTQMGWAGTAQASASGNQGLDILIQGMYSQAAIADSGVSGAIYLAEISAVPHSNVFSSTCASANHQAGDVFSRFGIGHTAPNSGVGAWSASFRNLFIQLAEK
jgi:hypothetical protein